MSLHPTHLGVDLIDDGAVAHSLRTGCSHEVRLLEAGWGGPGDLDFAGCFRPGAIVVELEIKSCENPVVTRPLMVSGASFAATDIVARVRLPRREGSPVLSTFGCSKARLQLPGVVNAPADEDRLARSVTNWR